MKEELSSFVSCFLRATGDVGLPVAQFSSMVLGAIEKTVPDSAPSTTELIMQLIELRCISLATGP